MDKSMPFIELLINHNTKSTAKFIVEQLVENPDRMVEFMDCFYSDKKMTCQRAAWPLGMIAEEQPQLLLPYLGQLITTLDGPANDTIVRNILRAFQFVDFPPDDEGRVFDICLDILLDVNRAIAIRVFSMTVCANITFKYPSLVQELIPVIEEHIPHGSAGFRARGAKLLKQLKTLSP